MNNYEILATIIGAVGIIFGICGVAFPKLKGKDIDTGKVLETASTGLAVADNAVDTIKAIAPNLPYINIADKVIEYAQKGVRKAEQLYKANKISPEARKDEAIKLVKDCLTVMDVEVTPDIEKIIDGCVEAAVFALPKTDKPITPTIAVQKDDTAEDVVKAVMAM